MFKGSGFGVEGSRVPIRVLSLEALTSHCFVFYFCFSAASAFVGSGFRV